MNVYESIYLGLFNFHSKTKNFSATPQTVSSMFLSGLITINFIVISKGVGLGHWEIFRSEVFVVVVFLLTNAINYFIFLKSKKYKVLVEEFSNWSIKRRRVNSILTIAYILLTIALLIIV